jgi:hypothetical protein
VRNRCKHRYGIEIRNYLPVLVCPYCGAAWKSYAPTREGVPVSADRAPLSRRLQLICAEIADLDARAAAAAAERADAAEADPAWDPDAV